MNTIKQRLTSVKSQIDNAEQLAKRDSGSVKLLAVSKTKPATDIASAYQAGQRHFGESYLQEALDKQNELAAFNISWHFIGHIQSNKTKVIATYFSWVHSVDRLKIAQRLSAQRPAFLPRLNILIQVNVSCETTKSGVQLDKLPQLIQAINELPRLRLCGVMAIPQPCLDYQQQRQPYRDLYQAVTQLESSELTEFSFGMSADLIAAIVEGATIVRVGTALFGSRVT